MSGSFPLGSVYSYPGRSTFHIDELQRNTKITGPHPGNYPLQVIEFFACHPYLIIHNGRLYLQLGVFNGLYDFFGGLLIRPAGL